MVQKDDVNSRQMLLFMTVAYLFSLAVRMIWVYQVQGEPSFYWNGQLMINTNDGYYFASGAQKVLEGLHMENSRIPDMWKYGTVFFTVLLTKITPFSLETVILYMPAFVSSLVVIPIILISRLFGMTVWGFFSALLGAVVWSYYNRTMTGYYDTDMFSAMAPMFILYFLMKSTIDFNLRSALYAALAISVYPFLYEAGATIVNAMGVIYAAYLIIYHRKEDTTYHSIVLVFLSLVPLPLPAPWSYLMKIVLLVLLFMVFRRVNIRKETVMGMGIFLFFLFMWAGNVFGLIYSKVIYYTTTGTASEGLHFYSVSQTIREAGKVLFFPLPEGMPYKANIAHRMMGSSIGLIMAVVGYLLLVLRHRVFLLALPLIGIGLFAHWGGLRFTVYAVPVAAMSALYLVHYAITRLTEQKAPYFAVMGLFTAALLYPNLTHIIAYRVPTVMNSAEVADLDRLRKISSEKDYTIAWWDYGYPLWFYADTNTLIDGGKHNNDNFIVSKIMQTTSPELAANLGRLAVETYVDSNYSVIADKLFSGSHTKPLDPNLFLAELESRDYRLPPKSRDVYLYMPYRMLGIFPTVAKFGNLDLVTGEKERDIVFYPTRVAGKEKGVLQFSNGIVFDMQKGILLFGKEKRDVKRFVVTQLTREGKSTKIQTQTYHPNGRYIVLFMQSYGDFIIMDEDTFHSTYTQMFILGRYDKELFELVVSSPYSKIYRLRK